MKLVIVVAVAVSLVTVRAFGRIGETRDQLQRRYGAPIKQAFGDGGEGMCIYHADGFKEVRVHFSKGRSDQEEYVVGYPSPPSLGANPDLVKRIQSENPNQKVDDRYDRVRVSSEAQAKNKFAHEEITPSGREHTYSGVAKIRSDEQGQWAVLKDHDTVLELPTFGPHYSTQYVLESGHKYSVTLLEQWSQGVNGLVGVVSKREHVDWIDCVDDPGVNAIQQLIRITDGDKVIFDHSICSLHHVKMELRNVEIAYGMLAYSKAESYCTAHYPNFRDFAAGGCVVSDDSPKSAVIYICPKCVAECNEYKRQHPEENKNPLD